MKLRERDFIMLLRSNHWDHFPCVDDHGAWVESYPAWAPGRQCIWSDGSDPVEVGISDPFSSQVNTYYAKDAIERPHIRYHVAEIAPRGGERRFSRTWTFHDLYIVDEAGQSIGAAAAVIVNKNAPEEFKKFADDYTDPFTGHFAGRPLPTVQRDLPEPRALGASMDEVEQLLKTGVWTREYLLQNIGGTSAGCVGDLTTGEVSVHQYCGEVVIEFRTDWMCAGSPEYFQTDPHGAGVYMVRDLKTGRVLRESRRRDAATSRHFGYNDINVALWDMPDSFRLATYKDIFGG